MDNCGKQYETPPLCHRSPSSAQSLSWLGPPEVIYARFVLHGFWCIIVPLYWHSPGMVSLEIHCNTIYFYQFHLCFVIIMTLILRLTMVSLVNFASIACSEAFASAESKSLWIQANYLADGWNEKWWTQRQWKHFNNIISEQRWPIELSHGLNQIE